MVFYQLFHEGCLSTLLIVSFVVPKLLILIRSHLFIFAFIQSLLSDPGPEISEGTNLANDDIGRFRFKVLYNSV